MLIYVDTLSYLQKGIMLEHHFASRLRRDHAMPTLISQRVEEGGIPAGISQAEREADHKSILLEKSLQLKMALMTSP